MLPKSKQLKKGLGLWHVYALATGSTLSGGFFLLPGLAYQKAGPAMILSYMLATIPLIPAIFSMIELCTAMPRAGGVYYFLDRSMGPMIGAIGGIGTWLLLVLKVAFALIGIGAYLSLFIDMDYTLGAILLALVFALVNILGAKQTARLQTISVSILLLILFTFIFFGLSMPVSEFHHFSPFFPEDGFQQVIATAGFVYMSYVGISKVASVSEEVKNPEKNLPLGTFLAFGTILLVYALGTGIMVAVLPSDEFSNNLTPVASAAEYIFGKAGIILVTIAAILAFASVANAGIMSASRYPFAMSRDAIFPSFLQKLSSRKIPLYSVLLSVGLIIFCIACLDPAKIAKLASAFQLLIFSLLCLAVIIMRESQISSYDPGYKSPFYPWMQIAGILIPAWFITAMGWLSIGFTLGLLLIAILWYTCYAKAKTKRGGAILYVFERLGRHRYDGLDLELRGILREKGLRPGDPFDELIVRADILDLPDSDSFATITKQASDCLAKRLSKDSAMIAEEFMQGSRSGLTPLEQGAALPHLRLHGIKQAELVVVRIRSGIKIESVEKDLLSDSAWVHAIFYLVSPDDDAKQPLRILARLAEYIDGDQFMTDWLSAKNKQELKELLFLNEHFIFLLLEPKTPSENLIGKQLQNIEFPKDSLVTMIRRRQDVIVPSGKTVLEAYDRLTIVGEPKSMRSLRKHYIKGEKEIS